MSMPRDSQLPSGDALPRQDTVLMPNAAPNVGSVLDGRYRLDALLGEGGMGAVYRGTHVLMGKPVAVKLIHGELAHIPEVAARFEREARSASLLRDPHCITVTDFGRTEDGVLYLAMELLEGDDLSSRIARSGALPVLDALRLISQVASALSHAHAAGVVHRDLKPENIMLVRHGDEEDFAKVIDFGIARIADSAAESNVKLTRSGFVLGTPAYLSPEQALGEMADHRADLYALGVILYETLAGRQPYTGESAMDVVTHHLSTPVPRLPRQRYTPELQAIIDKAMAKRPQDRFQSAAQLQEAINALPAWAVVASPSWVERIIPRSYEDRLRLGVSAALQRWRTLPAKVQRFSIIGLSALVLVGLVALVFGSGQNSARQATGDSRAKLEVVNGPGVDEKQLQTMLELADTQLRSGQAQEAAITAQEILDMSPKQWAAHLLLGHARFAQGQRQQALEAYAKALEAEPALAADIRLGEYLDAALTDDCCRAKAAILLVERGGKRGLERVADKASSPVAEIETRKACRSALLAAGKQNSIDWLASLTADLEQAKNCADRKAVIEAIAERQDPRFVPLLKSKLPSKGRRRNLFRRQSSSSFACVTDELNLAIAASEQGAEF